MDNVLQEAGLIDDQCAIISELTCIDRIGPIPGADGYHVNLRLLYEPTDEQVEALYPVTILALDTPSRVCA